MNKSLIRAVFCIPLLAAALAAQLRTGPVDWESTLDRRLPLLGHRNWIMVVDAAYPLQNIAGLETIETNTGLLRAVSQTLTKISQSRHLRANVFQDAELAAIPEADAPGIQDFRSEISNVLSRASLALPQSRLPHEQLIAMLAAAGKDFRILVLKTTETLPYTSVFLQLDCKYWSADAEKRLRSRLSAK